MDERFCTAGELELCYETFGDPADPTLLLIMGLGTQMLGWHEDFCRLLADHGLHVVRYDNRDIGRSTHLDDLPVPTPRQLILRRPPSPGYDLGHMAQDAAGLLDGLGVDAAHVVGASMGGMIAQTLAARRPERVRSLTSIMSTTGGRTVGQPALRVLPMFLQRPSTDRDSVIERTVKLFAMVGSPGFERDEAALRELAGASYDRDHDPRGSGRQLAAILRSGDRTAEVRRISAPTLVIHGDKDRLVRPSGGKATARAIRGARLELIAGMGHDLPRPAWPQLVELIAGHVRRTGAVAGAAAA